MKKKIIIGLAALAVIGGGCTFICTKVIGTSPQNKPTSM
jgi:hypothetical protein